LFLAQPCPSGRIEQYNNIIALTESAARLKQHAALSDRANVFFYILILCVTPAAPKGMESFSLTLPLGERPCEKGMVVQNFSMALHLYLSHACWARVSLTRRGRRGRRGI